MPALSREVLAHAFAGFLTDRARTTAAWWETARRAADATTASEAPQYLFHPLLRLALDDFARAWGLPPESIIVDGGGQSDGDPQRRNYSVFGTVAHPDAAVVEPFRCAIEYDVQPRGAAQISGFKQRLGKPMLHVLSGAYDAVAHIYVLSEDTTPLTAYPIVGRDEPTPANAYSLRAMEGLRASGHYLAVLPGFEQPTGSLRRTKPI